VVIGQHNGATRSVRINAPERRLFTKFAHRGAFSHTPAEF